MCQYYDRIVEAIQRKSVFNLSNRSQCSLKIDVSGGIRYTKVSLKSGKSYSKVIPMISLRKARQLFDTWEL